MMRSQYMRLWSSGYDMKLTLSVSTLTSTSIVLSRACAAWREDKDKTKF